MQPSHISTTIYAVGFVIIVLTGLIMGLVIYAYARIFIGSIIGVFAAGLGGLSATRDAARSLAFRIIGGGLHLLTLMIVMQLGLTFAQNLRGDTSGLTAALLSLFADVLVLVLCWQLPSGTARLSEG